MCDWPEVDNTRLSYVFEKLDAEVGHHARALVRWCLQGDPAKRPMSMAEVLAAPFATLRVQDGAVVERHDQGVDEQARIDGAAVGTRGAAKSKRAAAATAGPSVDSIYPDGSYAVVVGINDYLSSGIGPDAGGMGDLKSARQDAELVRETLQAKGFTILKEIYDKDVTKDNFLDLLDGVTEALEGKVHARGACGRQMDI